MADCSFVVVIYNLFVFNREYIFVSNKRTLGLKGKTFCFAASSGFVAEEVEFILSP